MGFREALLTAAEKAWDAGQIRMIDYFRLARLSLRPSVQAEMKECVTKAAIKAGVVKPAAINASAFDWAKLIEFFMKILQMLLDLFGPTRLVTGGDEGD